MEVHRLWIEDEPTQQLQSVATSSLLHSLISCFGGKAGSNHFHFNEFSYKSKCKQNKGQGLDLLAILEPIRIQKCFERLPAQ